MAKQHKCVCMFINVSPLEFILTPNNNKDLNSTKVLFYAFMSLYLC